MSYQVTSSTSTTQRTYLKPVTITQGSSNSRDSSRDSHRSHSSTDSQYTSSSNGPMGSSNREHVNDDRVRYLRVPDNDGHFIAAITSRSGKNEVIDHKAARIDYDEPRASSATSEDYKRKQEREWRKREAGRRSGK